MVETFQTKLSDSKLWRWTALILLASAMFFAYIFVDILSPLQEFLQTQRGWDPVAYGHYAGSEPFLNVFVFFLIFAGIILDKMGVRFTAVLSGMVMVVGAGINYYAVSDFFVESSMETFFTNTLNLPQAWWNVTPFYAGMPASAKLSAIGFMIFGCGAEMAGITVSRGIVKWFKGKEMALAMGIEMAIARVGVAVVVVASPALAAIKPTSVSRPVAFELVLLCIGLICFGIFFAIIALSAGVSSMSSGNIGGGPAIAMFLLFIPIYFVLASLTNLTSYTCYRSIWTDPPLRRNGR